MLTNNLLVLQLCFRVENLQKVKRIHTYKYIKVC